MVGLPNVGSDAGVWGTELNTFLNVAHNSNGTINGAGSGLDSRYGLKPAASDTVVYVSASTSASDSNDGLSMGSAFATIQHAVSVLPVGGGRIHVGAGTYTTSSQINLNGLTGVVIEGPVGRTAGAGAGALLVYTGTAASFVTAQSSIGCRLLNLYIEYTNSGFTGNLIDVRNVSSTDTAFFLMDNCIVTGSGVSTAAGLVALDKCNSSEIANCDFSNAQAAILGRSSGGYSNAIRIRGNQFVGLVVCPIVASGQAWLIDGNTFEALQSGAAAAYSYGTGQGGNGVCFLSNWFGDVTNGGTWITWAGNNLIVRGNYIAGDASATGIAVTSSSCFGIEIVSNQFAILNKAVDLGSTTGHTNFAVMFNTYTTVTTKVNATTWPTGGIHYDGANFRVGNAQLTGTASGSGFGTIVDAITSGDSALTVRGGLGFEIVSGKLKLDNGVTLVQPLVGALTTSTSLALLPPVVVTAKNVITVTLNAPGNGTTVTVKNVDSVNSVTVATSSGTIDGASTLVLTALQAATFIGDGANWWVISNR